MNKANHVEGTTNKEGNVNPGTISNNRANDILDNLDPKKRTIFSIVRDFKNTCDSIKSSINLAKYAERTGNDTTSNKISEFLQQQGVMEQIDGDKKYRISVNAIPALRRLVTRSDRIQSHSKVFTNSVLIYLVSAFDHVLYNVLKSVFTKYPNLMYIRDRDNSSEKEKSVSYSKIIEKSSSYDEIINYMVEREVEIIMRKSHEEMFKKIEQITKIEISKVVSRYPMLIEIFERRNLVVHTNGVVSEQYLDKINKFNKLTVTKGDILEVDYNYLQSSLEIIFESGIEIAHILWNKIIDDEPILKSVNELMYISLMEEENDLAARIGKFAIENLFSKKSNHVLEMHIVLNYAQALKWNGDDAQCKLILEAYRNKFDRKDHFLAIAVLNNDFEKAANIMVEIDPDYENFLEGCHEWPILKEFRRTDFFKKAYSDLFKKDFEQIYYTLSENEKTILGLQ